MNNSGVGCSSFSVATTVFVSLAICAVISYGVFYYFKQRLSVIEQSQMEQARVMQAFISRSIMHQHDTQVSQMIHVPVHHKEVNITESGLIEVSSDSESESDYDNDSGSESGSESESGSGSESGSESGSGSESEQIQLDDVIPDVIIDSSDKKIISLNKTALGEEESDSDNESDINNSFELKIGYKNNDAKKTQAQSIHLNYGNMSVSALRQLAKERGLVNDDNELQKLKKKDLVQLLQ
jgi:hypothetical protein